VDQRDLRDELLETVENGYVSFEIDFGDLAHDQETRFVVRLQEVLELLGIDAKDLRFLGAVGLQGIVIGTQ
jgi:hypothetical protein